MFTNDEDIRVFGCNTKGDPPSDIPNEDFSQQLVDFREYIHKQVVSQLGWKAKEIGSLENYLCLVWDCLNNSDFDLSFETVIERHVPIQNLIISIRTLGKHIILNTKSSTIF